MNKKQVYFSCNSCRLPSNSLPLMKDTQIISSENKSQSENDHDSDYSPEECERKLWSVSDFHDFCRELNLSKKMSLKCLKMLKSDPEIKES